MIFRMGRTSLLCLCISLSISSMAFGGLGQSESSCEDEAQFFNVKSHEVVTNEKYKVHTLRLNSGMVINEYVANNIVFGVSWRGTRYHPQFDKLLGVHFNEYKAHENELHHHKGTRNETPNSKGSRFSTLRTTKIVMTLGGHMGSPSGSAFAPNSMPEGLSMDEVR